MYTPAPDTHDTYDSNDDYDPEAYQPIIRNLPEDEQVAYEQELRNKYSRVSKRDKKGDSSFSENELRNFDRKYKAAMDEKKIRGLLTEEELPSPGRFTLYPPLERLKRYTLDEIRHIRNVRISNRYGEIEFLEPVSLCGVDLDKVIVIGQNVIEVSDPKLEEKKMRLTFYNFGSYTQLNAEEREKMKKKMNRWMERCRMTLLHFDEDNGDLMTEILEH